MLRVAFAGRAVSPVTSYLATEPGVRPSTEGLLDEEIGESLGLAGLGLVGAGAGGDGSGAAPLPSIESLLAPAVDRCVAAHKPASGWKVELELETTGVEIVDVQATSPAAHDAPPPGGLGRQLDRQDLDVELGERTAGRPGVWCAATSSAR